MLAASLASRAAWGSVPDPDDGLGDCWSGGTDGPAVAFQEEQWEHLQPRLTANSQITLLILKTLAEVGGSSPGVESEKPGYT